jgi:hypothetical protein
VLLENCENAEAGSAAISVRHPGISTRGMPPGTLTIGRMRRLNADGVRPTRCVNSALKLPRLEKPTSMHTSVTDRSPVESKCLARSRRASMRS